MAERPPVPSEEVVRQLVARALEAAEASASGSAPITLAPTASSASPIGEPAASDPRTVALGADHGGFALKQAIAKALAEKGYAVTDCGTTSTEAVDYPDFAHVVARLVASGSCSVGIVIDGAGIGSAMAANKVPGVRAANAHDTSMARNAREHNFANVLTLGGRTIGEGLALEIVETFLATPWGAERHGRRVAKIRDIEQQYSRATLEGAVR
ncbi:MAG: ribose 5-phosphate isomerase B [Chloroflexota bacterium]